MSEVRLIDANALKKAIQNDLDIGDNVGDDGYYNAMNMCLEYIDNAPTVDITRKIQSELISEVSHSIARQFLEHNEVVPFWLSIGGIRIKENFDNGQQSKI